MSNKFEEDDAFERRLEFVIEIGGENNVPS